MKTKNLQVFITTPIYYPNDNLHIGHAYTTILADFFNRYKQSLGYKTFFLTGADEHGDKISKNAKKENEDIDVFLNKKIENFKKLWEKLGIEYDYFLRTNDQEHKIFVQNFYLFLKNKKLIYQGLYQGWYCLNDEAFFTKSQIETEKTCPICGQKLQFLKEKSLFLQINQFKSWIKKNLENETFLIPESRRKELLNNFIPELQDLSISRKNVKWGISIPDNPEYTFYVWFDALLNYLSALNIPHQKKWAKEKIWEKENETEIVQIIGKEITRFHAIYWPIILNIKNYKLPKIISHGWLVDDQNRKMSKSLGNIIEPFSLIKEFGKDAIRFYFLYNINFETDGKFSKQLLKKTINGILVNKYSNLIHRTSTVIFKKYNGLVPKLKSKKLPEFEVKIDKKAEILKNNFLKEMDNLSFNQATKFIVEYVNLLNNYIDNSKFWTLDTEDEKLKIILNFLITHIWNLSILFSGILIDSTEQILKMYNLSKINLKDWNKNFENKQLKKIEILFKRLT